jgi:hypothetical protein
MRRLNHHRLNRFLQRCEEIVQEPGMSSIVTHVYQGALKQKADIYRGAFDAIAVAESAAGQAELAVGDAVEELEAPYKAARSVVLAMAPATVVPATLAAQTTDTDMLYAIKTLVDVISAHTGQVWADDLLKGEFGTKSANATDAITKAISAKKALDKAIDERAGAFDPAYKALVAFRRVVRDALGPSSKQYQRLHVRARPDSEEPELEDETEAPRGAQTAVTEEAGATAEPA